MSKSNMRVTNIASELRPVAGETSVSVTVGATAVAGLDGNTLSDQCKYLLVTTSGQMRYRLDGSNPTATVGHYLSGNNEAIIDRETFEQMVFIRDTGAGSDGSLYWTQMSY